MDEREAVRALATVGLRARSVQPILGGWASWTFVADGEHIVRFPRTDDVAAAAARELALLPELAAHVSFAVPEPSHVGTWNDRPFFAYPLIAGRPLTADDASPALRLHVGAALAELHAFPLDRAAELLGIGVASGAWRRHYERVWPIVEEHALPAVGPAVAAEVRAAFAAFMEHVDALPLALVHNDLGLEHLLVGPDPQELAGIIDFEDATIGDPAIDLVPLVAAFGREPLVELLDGGDLGPRLDERMHFYRWMGSLHAIVYGVTQGVPAEVAHGRRELTRRLHAPVVG